MPDWIKTLLDLLSQFTGGSGGIDNVIVNYVIAAIFWSGLLAVSISRYREDRRPRERLLIWGFALALARELFMVSLAVVQALKLVKPASLHAIFPPLEHALHDLGIITVSAGFILYLGGRPWPARRYLRAGIATTLACYLATAWWWADFIGNHPDSKFGQTWCEWVFHINPAAWMLVAAVYLWRHTRGWSRNAICTAQAALFTSAVLQLPDMARGEVYENVFTPISRLFYLGAILVLGYVLIREQIEERRAHARSLEEKIRERKQAEVLLHGQTRVLEMIATGAPLAESLTALLRHLETQSPEMLCSILLLDADGVHVRHGAAPSLPEAFNRAIDGQPIGPRAGSCGTAAFRREAVIVGDIATDPLWADYRDFALSHGLRACWSTPIFDATRGVLGTFAIYYGQPGLPTAWHQRLIEIATQTAAIGIAKMRTEAVLAESEEKFSKAFRNSPDAILLTTLDGRILDANAGMTRLTGYQLDEARGRTTMELGLWTAAADRERYITALREHGRALDLEASLRTRLGERRTCTVSGELMDLGGQPVIVGIIRDITERKQAEVKLHESESRFRAIFEQAAVGVAQVAPDGSWLDVNPRFCDIVGYTREELLARTFQDITHPEDLDADLGYVRQMLSGEIRAYAMEKRYLRKGGDIVWVNLTVSLVRGPENAPKYFASVVEDITARKKAEAALEAERQFSSGVLDSLPGVFYLVTPERRLLRWNKNLERITGLSAETLATMDASALFPPEDLPTVQEGFMKVLQDGEASVEVRLVRGQGSTAPYFFTGIRMHVGPTPCMAGIGIDISERKLAEENLSASEASLMAAQARAHLGSWDLDLAAMKGTWSAEMSRLHGRDPALDAPTFEEFLKLIHPEDRRVILGVHSRLPEALDPIAHEYRTDPSRGPVRHLSATVHVIRDATGRAVQAAGTTLDITTRRIAEEQLRALAAKLASARETESARIARELHDELGGALTALKMDVAWMNRQAAELAGPDRDAPLRERGRATLGTIDTTIQSIRRICLELHPAVLDQLGLATAIEWLANDFGQRHGIACAVARPESIPMDSARAITVFRIVQEILTNVSRHAQARSVRIRMRNRADHFFLRVTDDGRGFSERGSGERTGLGLIGMRERATAAGGRLKIMSAPGRGTTVTLSVLSSGIPSG